MIVSSSNGMGGTDDALIFTNYMKTNYTSGPDSEWEVLIVDDEKDVHSMTKMVLKNYSFLGQKIKFFSAFSAGEAKQFLSENENIALILLDVVMEEKNAGLKLVEYIREELDNETVRIILRTAHPGAAPEERVIKDYVINDYIEKGDITNRRLMTTVTTSLRSYNDLIALKDSIAELQRLSYRLKKANDRLKTLSEEKAQLITFLYHELLTPLNHIGASQIFDLDSMSSENLEILEMVKGGFVRLDNMIKAFLRYFEFMGSDLDIEPEPIAVKEQVDMLVREYRQKLEEKNLSVKVNVTDSLRIMIDPNYFPEIVNVLLDNAIKYSTENGTIEIAAEIGRNAKACFSVSDTGRGINKKILNAIFEAYNVEEHYRHESGYGLNLAMIKYIIESHDGTIWAESEGSNKGAKFIFEV